jgi:hypothetical protein
MSEKEDSEDLCNLIAETSVTGMEHSVPLTLVARAEKNSRDIRTGSAVKPTGRDCTNVPAVALIVKLHEEGKTVPGGNPVVQVPENVPVVDETSNPYEGVKDKSNRSTEAPLYTNASISIGVMTCPAVYEYDALGPKNNIESGVTL